MARNFLKLINPDQVLVPHLDLWFSKNKEKVADCTFSIRFHKKPDTAFHPSSHATECDRVLSYVMAGNQLPNERFNSAQMQKTFINGHMWHGLLQWIITDQLGFASKRAVEASAGILRTPQGFCVDYASRTTHLDLKDYRWWAKGAIDVWPLNVPGHDIPYVVDIKTMEPIQFKADRPNEFLWRKYLAQTNLYMDWVGADKCIVLAVESASPFRLKEIMVERDDEMVKSIYEKWDRVADAATAGVLLPHSCANPDRCAGAEL